MELGQLFKTVIGEMTKAIKAFRCQFSSSGAQQAPSSVGGYVAEDGETKDVLIDFGGNYYYIDNNGNKVKIPEGSNFVPIASDNYDIEQETQCFDTGTGTVRVLTLRSLDKDLKILKRSDTIESSTDATYSQGDKLDDGIPSTWTYVMCANKESQKHLNSFEGCITDGTDTVKVEYMEVLGNDLSTTNKMYVVLESTSAAYTMGDTFTEMPTGWDYTECVIEEKQKDATHINSYESCYWDPTSDKTFYKATYRVRYSEVVNDKLEVLSKSYTIVESLSTAHQAGETMDELPANWTIAECVKQNPLTSTVSYEMCFESNHPNPYSRTKILDYRIINAYTLENISNAFIVLESNDVNQVGTWLFDIPNTWEHAICDDEMKSHTHLNTFESCYKDGDDDIKIKGTEVMKDDLTVLSKSYVVLSSTSASYEAGNELIEIPGTWVVSDCVVKEEKQPNTHINSYQSCYWDPDDEREGLKPTYQIMTVEMRKDDLSVISTSYVVIDSSYSRKHPIGEVLQSIPTDWRLADCDIKHQVTAPVSYELCYENTDKTSPMQKTKVMSYRIEDIYTLDDVSTTFIILDSEVKSEIGSWISVIPNTWESVTCDEELKYHTHLNSSKTCYVDGEDKFSIDSLEVVKDDLTVLTKSNIVVSSTSAAYAIGSTLPTIPATWVASDCIDKVQFSNYINSYDTCITDGSYKLGLNCTESVDEALDVIKKKYTVVKSSSTTYSIGQIIDDIPFGWYSSDCNLEYEKKTLVHSYDICATDDMSKVKLNCTEVFDERFSVSSRQYTVTESTSMSLRVGDTMDSIPYPWHLEGCTNSLATHLNTFESCYTDGLDTFKIRTTEIVDDNLTVISQSFKVLKSTSTTYTEGESLTDLPNSWSYKECTNEESKLYLTPRKVCLSDGTSKLYIKGYVFIDDDFAEHNARYVVDESTSTTIKVGDVLTEYPNGYNVIECNCKSGCCDGEITL